MRRSRSQSRRRPRVRERRCARAGAGSRCRTSARGARRTRRPSDQGAHRSPSANVQPFGCDNSSATFGCTNEEVEVEVTREIVLEAPIDEVWDALTDPGRLEGGSRTTSSSTSSPAGTASSAGTTARNVARSCGRSTPWPARARLGRRRPRPDRPGRGRRRTRVVVTETAGSGWATALSLRALPRLSLERRLRGARRPHASSPRRGARAP